MMPLINKLLGRRTDLNRLLAAKRQKLSQTELYLRSRRKSARPQVPMGFTSRNNASYYLTSRHNHI